MSLFNRTKCPIGIDIGSHSIKMLQLEPHGDSWKVLSADMQILPPELPAEGDQRIDMLAGMIKSMLAGGNFTGKKAVTCLANSAIQYKNLRLPPMPADDLKTAVQWEAADRLNMNSENTCLQYFDAGQVRQGDELRQEVILMAADGAAVEEQLAIMSHCDLQPVGIEAIPSALARSMSREEHADGQSSARVILDVGYHSSKVLIARHGRVVFYKTIDLGGKNLDETVARRLKLSIEEANEFRLSFNQEDESSSDLQPMFGTTGREGFARAVYEALRSTVDDLARELGLCLRYYSVTFRGQRPEDVILVGGEAGDQNLVRILAETAGVNVQSGRPLVDCDIDGGIALGASRSCQGQWAVAAGLSMRGETKSRIRGAA